LNLADIKANKINAHKVRADFNQRKKEFEQTILTQTDGKEILAVLPTKEIESLLIDDNCIYCFAFQENKILNQNAVSKIKNRVFFAQIQKQCFLYFLDQKNLFYDLFFNPLGNYCPDQDLKFNV
jgi:hypothetical protein